MMSRKLPSLRASSLAMMGSSHHAERARANVRRVAGRAGGVMIVGPEGSGRESLARSIHASGARGNRPFVVVNCEHLVDGRLFESQLFGHLPGAFAGLKTSSLGLIQAAHGGTLFLRDLEAMPLDSQAKLFPALRDQKVVPLGGSEAIPVDVRVIASTRTEFATDGGAGLFHEGLFQLLAEHLVEVSRLADRMEDVPALANEIAREISQQRNLPTRRFSTSATDWLTSYEWPGNLRELNSAIEGAISVDAEEIDSRSLRLALRKLNARSVIALARRTHPTRFAGFAAMRSTGTANCRA